MQRLYIVVLLLVEGELMCDVFLEELIQVKVNMGKVFVIVEFLVKVKMINKYLGNDYVVKFSVGYICDLLISGLVFKKSVDFIFIKMVKKFKKDECGVFVNCMGVDLWYNWDVYYEVLFGKEKVVFELKQLVEKVDYIYFVIDFDCEGEVIVWYLWEVIGGDDVCYSCVVFNEIIKNVICQVFEQLGELNINRVNVQ